MNGLPEILIGANGSGGNNVLGITAVNSKEQLLSQLLGAMRTGRLKVGDRLLNERDLAEFSTLSRSTVRDVLNTLEKQGLLERRVGRDTFLIALPGHGPLGEPGNESLVTPAELIEFRLTVEPALADLLVLKLSDAEIDRIRGELLAGRHATSWDEVERIDRDFHLMLYSATQNAMFIESGRKVARMRNNPAWLRLKAHRFNRERWLVFQREHEAILDALAMRDAQTVADLLRHHISGVRMDYALNRSNAINVPKE